MKPAFRTGSGTTGGTGRKGDKWQQEKEWERQTEGSLERKSVCWCSPLIAGSEVFQVWNLLSILMGCLEGCNQPWAVSQRHCSLKITHMPLQPTSERVEILIPCQRWLQATGGEERERKSSLSLFLSLRPPLPSDVTSPCGLNVQMFPLNIELVLVLIHV